MNKLPKDYLDSIQASLEDLRKADAPVSVWRALDRHVAEVRDFWVEFSVPKGKTLCDVFAEEKRAKPPKMGI